MNNLCCANISKVCARYHKNFLSYSFLRNRQHPHIPTLCRLQMHFIFSLISQIDTTIFFGKPYPVTKIRYAVKPELQNNFSRCINISIPGQAIPIVVIFSQAFLLGTTGIGILLCPSFGFLPLLISTLL